LKDPYKILQVDPDAEMAVIEAAYRGLARHYHPDVNPNPEAAERMQEINWAYDILHDPEKRKAYAQSRKEYKKSAESYDNQGHSDQSEGQAKAKQRTEENVNQKNHILSCQSCGLIGPTKNVSFRYNIGLLFIRFNRHLEGYLCRNCIEDYFWKYTAINLFLGWWGLISFFVTPFFILENLISYVAALNLKKREDESGIRALGWKILVGIPLLSICLYLGSPYQALFTKPPISPTTDLLLRPTEPSIVKTPVLPTNTPIPYYLETFDSYPSCLGTIWESNSSIVSRIYGGEYQITVKPSDKSWRNWYICEPKIFSDFDLEMDILIKDFGNGDIGLEFRDLQYENKFYLYLLNISKSPLYLSSYSLLYYDGNTFNNLLGSSDTTYSWVLLPTTYPESLKTAKNHKLGVSAKGSKITLFLDNYEINNIIDNNLTSGVVGFFVENGTLNSQEDFQISLDNFVITPSTTEESLSFAATKLPTSVPISEAGGGCIYPQKNLGVGSEIKKCTPTQIQLGAEIERELGASNRDGIRLVNLYFDIETDNVQCNQSICVEWVINRPKNANTSTEAGADDDATNILRAIAKSGINYNFVALWGIIPVIDPNTGLSYDPNTGTINKSRLMSLVFPKETVYSTKWDSFSSADICNIANEKSWCNFYGIP
jgi:hypothetical protein